MTESLVLSVGVPLIVGLIVSMVLFKGVIKVTIEPVELGHDSQEEGHLTIIIRGVVVSCADWV